MNEKAKLEGTKKNPNKTIWNFSSHDLTNDEYDTLKYGLRHGIAMQPDENEILASTEAVWNQIATKNLCKDGAFYQRRAKSHLRAMALILSISKNNRYLKTKER